MSATAAGQFEQTDVGAFPVGRIMTIPGQGEQPEGCGTWSPMQFCRECAEPHFGQERCDRRTCPHCWKRWIKDRAASATKRLSVARQLEEPGIDRRVVHAVVSPPEGVVRTLTDVDEGFSRAYDLVKEKGVPGGVAMFHPFRVTDEAESQLKAAGYGTRPGSGSKGGYWKGVRNDVLGWGGWREYVKWGPHYHVLGLSSEFGENNPDEQEGWVVKRVRSLAPYRRLSDREAYDDIIGAVRYLASHAGFKKYGQFECVRWFGAMATSKFSVDRAIAEGDISAGAVAIIERHIADALGRSQALGEGEEGEKSVPECRNCGAEGTLAPIWDAFEYWALNSRPFKQRVEEEYGEVQVKRLEVAANAVMGLRRWRAETAAVAEAYLSARAEAAVAVTDREEAEARRREVELEEEGVVEVWEVPSEYDDMDRGRPSRAIAL